MGREDPVGPLRPHRSAPDRDARGGGGLVEELVRVYRDERAPLDRDPRPRPRRSRPRRGRGTGRLRPRRRTLAARRSATQSRCLDRHDGPERGHRPDPQGADARTQDGVARAGRGAPRRRGGRNSRRPARADLRLLPPGARAGGAGRADARPRRPSGEGPRSRAHSWSRSRRSHSGSFAPSERSATPASRCACRRSTCCPSGCDSSSRRSISSSTPVTGRPCAANCAARRSGSPPCSRRSCRTRPRRTACTRCSSCRTRAVTRASRLPGELVLLGEQDREPLGHR